MLKKNSKNTEKKVTTFEIVSIKYGYNIGRGYCNHTMLLSNVPEILKNSKENEVYNFNFVLYYNSVVKNIETYGYNLKYHNITKDKGCEENSKNIYDALCTSNKINGFKVVFSPYEDAKNTKINDFNVKLFTSNPHISSLEFENINLAQGQLDSIFEYVKQNTNLKNISITFSQDCKLKLSEENFKKYVKILVKKTNLNADGIFKTLNSMIQTMQSVNFGYYVNKHYLNKFANGEITPKALLEIQKNVEQKNIDELRKKGIFYLSGRMKENLYDLYTDKSIFNNIKSSAHIELKKDFDCIEKIKDEEKLMKLYGLYELISFENEDKFFDHKVSSSLIDDEKVINENTLGIRNAKSINILDYCCIFHHRSLECKAENDFPYLTWILEKCSQKLYKKIEEYMFENHPKVFNDVCRLIKQRNFVENKVKFSKKDEQSNNKPETKNKSL